MMTEEDTGKTVVLIVEDEVLIRMGVADFIADEGIVPVEAGDADEALQILAERHDVDLVFTDVNMPGMNGLELSHIIARRWPSIQIIVTSGMVRPASAELVPGSLFYQKPYDLNRLVASINAMAS